MCTWRFCAGSSPSTSKSSVLLSFPSPYHTNAETLLNTKKPPTTTSSCPLRGKSGGSHDGLKAWREFYAVSLHSFSRSCPSSTDVASREQEEAAKIRVDKPNAKGATIKRKVKAAWNKKKKAEAAEEE
ncbi:hypothetical protein JCM16303_003657 [Sporobolomyces ruberrimus]